MVYALRCCNCVYWLANLFAAIYIRFSDDWRLVNDRGWYGLYCNHGARDITMGCLQSCQHSFFSKSIISFESCWLMYVFSLDFTIILTVWLVKLSVWCFMKRLIHGKWMNIAAYIVLGIIISSFITIYIFSFTWCQPIQSVVDLGPHGIALHECIDWVKVASGRGYIPSSLWTEF